MKPHLGFWAWEQASFHVVYPDWKASTHVPAFLSTCLCALLSLTKTRCFCPSQDKLRISIAPMEYMTSPTGSNIRHLWGGIKFGERSKLLEASEFEGRSFHGSAAHRVLLCVPRPIRTAGAFRFFYLTQRSMALILMDFIQDILKDPSDSVSSSAAASALPV